MPGRVLTGATTGSQRPWRRWLLGLLVAVLAVAGVFQAWQRWQAIPREARREAARNDRFAGTAKSSRVAARRGETSSGTELYKTHCAVCHGAMGNGLGQAARYLFPRPRDFGAGGLPLAGTQNGVASLEDVEKVLVRGIPGTSMPAFDGLAPVERTLLAQEVLRLRHERTRARIARLLREAGEEPTEVELGEIVQRTTTPGPPVPLPDHWPSGAEAFGRGRAVYQRLGCAKCHGDDGSGAADPCWFDDQGEPCRPRDLVREPFKGGRDPDSVYLRIAVGMPGTPHPSAPGLAQEELADLVHYVLALGRPPESLMTNHERRVRANPRVYREQLGR